MKFQNESKMIILFRYQTKGKISFVMYLATAPRSI